MKSYNVIFGSCIALWIIHWTSDTFPGGAIPLAFSVSFLIMDLFGMFKRETPAVQRESDEPEQTERQKEFKRLFDQAKEQNFEKPDAVVRMTDQDGNASSITIKANGEIITEGKANPDVIEAAKRLQSSIAQFGTDAVAKELGRQIDEIYRRSEEEDDDGK